MPDILIAEDYSIVRVGTMILIREIYPDARIVEAETFEEVLKELTTATFDLLLLDIHIPGGDNLQMIEAVHLRQPGVPILIFSSYEEHMYALRYMQAGAKGYLQKRSAPEEIKKAIQKVINNEKYMSNEVQQLLVNQALYADTGDGTKSLSNREMEVMQLLIKGATTSEIKISLNLQDSTVSTYKSRIFEKLQVSNVIELAEKVRLLNIEKRNGA
jgi:DNA-binding NarL/FixJ family response regulator